MRGSGRRTTRRSGWAQSGRALDDDGAASWRHGPRRAGWRRAGGRGRGDGTHVWGRSRYLEVWLGGNKREKGRLVEVACQQWTDEEGRRGTCRGTEGSLRVGKEKGGAGGGGGWRDDGTGGRDESVGGRDVGVTNEGQGKKEKRGCAGREDQIVGDGREYRRCKCVRGRAQVSDLSRWVVNATRLSRLDSDSDSEDWQAGSGAVTRVKGQHAQKSHSHAPTAAAAPGLPLWGRSSFASSFSMLAQADGRTEGGGGGQAPGRGRIYTEALEEDTTPLVSSHPPRSPRSRS